MKRSRQRGATKIMSEFAAAAAAVGGGGGVEKPSKSSHEANVDSTTIYDSSTTTNNTTANEASANANNPNRQQQHQLTAQGMLLLNSNNNGDCLNSQPVVVASSSAVVAYQTSSSTTTATAATLQQQQQQQQPFFSPQMSDIKSLFDCPICFDFATPPIYQCQNGHLVCQACSKKINHCPTCRVPINEPPIRNLQLDRLANTFQFPCKYNFNGCQWKSYWFKKREHEDACAYVSYTCPCPGTACKWTGLLSQVMAHLGEHHKSITTLSGEDIVFLATDINLKGAVDWVMIQSCFNHHFLLVLEKQELKTGHQQFFAVVQLIGSQKEAKKFKYKLELTSAAGSPTGQMRRLQWEAQPRSILDGIQTAIATYDCLVFDARTAQHFLSPIQKEGNDGQSQGENLGINVTIDCLI